MSEQEVRWVEGESGSEVASGGTICGEFQYVKMRVLGIDTHHEDMESILKHREGGTYWKFKWKRGRGKHQPNRFPESQGVPDDGSDWPKFKLVRVYRKPRIAYDYVDEPVIPQFVKECRQECGSECGSYEQGIGCQLKTHCNACGFDEVTEEA